MSIKRAGSQSGLSASLLSCGLSAHLMMREISSSPPRASSGIGGHRAGDAPLFTTLPLLSEADRRRLLSSCLAYFRIVAGGVSMGSPDESTAVQLRLIDELTARLPAAGVPHWLF